MTEEKIDNDVQEAYCGYLLSKLLKERGFSNRKPILEDYAYVYADTRDYSYREYERHDYRNEGPSKVVKVPAKIGELILRELSSRNEVVSVYERPTHQIANEWIQKNLGRWVVVKYNYNLKMWLYQVQDLSQESLNMPDSTWKLDISSERATEAGLLEALQTYE
jgi:hypothetical protein